MAACVVVVLRFFCFFLICICNKVEKKSDRQEQGRRDGRKEERAGKREIQQMVDLARPLPCSLCKSLSGKSTDPRSISHILRSHNHGLAAEWGTSNVGHYRNATHIFPFFYMFNEIFELVFGIIMALKLFTLVTETYWLIISARNLLFWALLHICGAIMVSKCTAEAKRLFTHVPACSCWCVFADYQIKTEALKVLCCFILKTVSREMISMNMPRVISKNVAFWRSKSQKHEDTF